LLAFLAKDFALATAPIPAAGDFREPECFDPAADAGLANRYPFQLNVAGIRVQGGGV